MRKEDFMLLTLQEMFTMTKYFGATYRIGYKVNKKILGGIAAITLVAVMAAFNINFNANKYVSSDLFWANIEALGKSEDQRNPCPGMIGYAVLGFSVPDDDWKREVINCISCEWTVTGFASIIRECR